MINSSSIFSISKHNNTVRTTLDSESTKKFHVTMLADDVGVKYWPTVLVIELKTLEKYDY